MPASPPTGPRTARLGVLDALRFLAALSVVGFHFTGITPAWDGAAPAELDPVSRWAAYGAMGVPLFFVISGFVVLMTAWGRDVPQFVASRVGRLFPAYWAAVVLAMLFAFVIWPAGAVTMGQAPTKHDALVNLTMLQGALGVPDLNGAFWTLWTEARFYALVAVLILVGITRGRVIAFAALWPLAGALAENADAELLATVLISDYSPYFAGGMLLYVLFRDGHDLLVWLLVGLQSLLALHFAVGFYPVGLPVATGRPVSTAVVALISFGCFGLVALATLTRLNRSAARWLTVLGALTYPVYLVHEKVGFFAIHVVRDGVSPWLALAAGTAASLACAAVLHHVVEKPWGGRLRAATLRALRHVPTPARAATEPEVARDPSTTQPQPRHPVAPVHTTGASHGAPRHAREALVPSQAGSRD